MAESAANTAHRVQDPLRSVAAAVRERRSARALTADAYDEWRHAIALAISSGVPPEEVASAAGTTVTRAESIHDLWHRSQ